MKVAESHISFPHDPQADAPVALAIRCLSRLIGSAFDMDPKTFAGTKKGSPEIVHARQVLFYLLHTEAGFDQAAIGKAMGRHRSTVGHAIQVVLGLREDPAIDAALTRLGEVYRDFTAVRARVPEIIEQLAP